MTQEEKLEEAKRLYETANADQKYVLERLFPELKESEDEKVRKAILAFLKETIEYGGISPDIWTMDNAKKWLAWLEKKGEKPQGKSAFEAINEEYDGEDYGMVSV